MTEDRNSIGSRKDLFPEPFDNGNENSVNTGKEQIRKPSNDGMDYPANAGKNEKQPFHTGNDFGTKPAHAVNFMKVAQSNHSLLIQGSRGKLRQVSFEDEPKVHRLQDEWSNTSEDEGMRRPCGR